MKIVIFKTLTGGVADKLPKAMTLDFSFVESSISKLFLYKKKHLGRRETTEMLKGPRVQDSKGQAQVIKRPKSE